MSILNINDNNIEYKCLLISKIFSQINKYPLSYPPQCHFKKKRFSSLFLQLHTQCLFVRNKQRYNLFTVLQLRQDKVYKTVHTNAQLCFNYDDIYRLRK